MNLNQLRYAKAVAETESFTQAAEQCYVTQPALSNGIAQLEQEFEERLFIRSTRNVSLTSFGRHILPFIERVLEAHDSLLHESRSFVRPANTVIRIGTSPLIRADWLTSMMKDFRKENPDIDIILHEQNMADLYRMLDDGLLDFVFGVAGSAKPSWASAFLYREPLYFIPRGGKTDKRDEIVFEDIVEDTFVMVPNVCGLARATRALFRSHRRKLHEYPGEALSYQVLEEWAALGLGAAILPRSKLRSPDNKAYGLTDNNGEKMYLDFEVVWLNEQQHQHLRRYAVFWAGSGTG